MYQEPREVACAFDALHLYGQVPDHAKRKKLPSTYGVRDVLTYLQKVVVAEGDRAGRASPAGRQRSALGLDGRRRQGRRGPRTPRRS